MALSVMVASSVIFNYHSAPPCLARKKIWLRLLRVRECVCRHAGEGMRQINRVPDAHARVGISAKWREGWVELAAVAAKCGSERRRVEFNAPGGGGVAIDGGATPLLTHAQTPDSIAITDDFSALRLLNYLDFFYLSGL
jgi:hypothetical protein